MDFSLISLSAALPEIILALLALDIVLLAAFTGDSEAGRRFIRLLAMGG